jgi:hypothetical protein
MPRVPSVDSDPVGSVRPDPAAPLETIESLRQQLEFQRARADKWVAVAEQTQVELNDLRDDPAFWKPKATTPLEGWQPTPDELRTVIRCVADYAGNENWAKRNEWIAEARTLLVKIKALPPVPAVEKK